MKRTACGSCDSSILQPFLDLGETPLADAFPRSPDEDETFYPLGLCVCHRCWLVQNTEVVPDDLLYNGDYGFYTGASPSSIAYFADYARWAVERFRPSFVVEIASNDGTLLRAIDNEYYPRGRRVLGVEPSANVAAKANADGIPTIVEPFGRKVAADIGKGSADLIIANNVIAHVSDLDDFIGGISDLLTPEGHAVIEFQYVGDLLAFNQFDHVYHEHRSFFSLDSLGSALEPHDLYIEHAYSKPTQGGSKRAVVVKGRPTLLPQYDSWLRSPDVYAGFQGRIDHLVDRLQCLFIDAPGAVAGYGASAKSTTLLNYSGILLDYVLDATPSKIGRYTPGTGIPIVDGPTRPDTTYVLLVWNYLSGVLEREREFRDAGGKFIVPIPMPVVL